MCLWRHHLSVCLSPTAGMFLAVASTTIGDMPWPCVVSTRWLVTFVLILLHFFLILLLFFNKVTIEVRWLLIVDDNGDAACRYRVLVGWFLSPNKNYILYSYFLNDLGRNSACPAESPSSSRFEFCVFCVSSIIYFQGTIVHSTVSRNRHGQKMQKTWKMKKCS
jgi:hypothetical protein